MSDKSILRQLRVSLFAAMTGVSLLGVSACIQMPTEQQKAVELRSQLAFVLQQPGSNVSGWRIFVDGLDMGLLSEFVSTTGARELRVLPGNHMLRIDTPFGTVFNEQMFIAEGATKTIVVPTQSLGRS